jgi:IMP cyclohydrolase (EC 3.5.4.10)/phosphoribosylaminoimidazolecarboxamide formyltransferase (EC 2.1.2.3)
VKEVKIKRALVSLSDKTGAVQLGQTLHAMGVQILSTGGTARSLQEAGIPVIEVSRYTGFPEMMDGRIKTLHPKIHGALLGKRDDAEHMKQMKTHGIEPIDLVVVNLYPFEKTVAKPDCTLEEAIENIDIGGPTMLRSSAKNYHDVAVVTDPQDYEKIIEEMKKLEGALSLETRFRLAKKVFKLTSLYDKAITEYLEKV